jgi:hypothetical protein
MGIIMPSVIVIVISAVPIMMIVVIALVVISVAADDIDLGISAVAVDDATVSEAHCAQE